MYTHYCTPHKVWRSCKYPLHQELQALPEVGPHREEPPTPPLLGEGAPTAVGHEAHALALTGEEGDQTGGRKGEEGDQT